MSNPYGFIPPPRRRRGLSDRGQFAVSILVGLLVLLGVIDLMAYWITGTPILVVW